MQDYVTPTMRLMGKGQKAFNPELMLPFGCRIVVHDVEPTGPQTLDRIVGFSGMMCGYGATTGHGGAYRAFNPGNQKVYTASYNHCTADETDFPWRRRQEWIDRRMDMPFSISPTPEAFSDAVELAKYDFAPDEIMEVATQLQNDFDDDYSNYPQPVPDIIAEDKEDYAIVELDLLDVVLSKDQPTHNPQPPTHFHASDAQPTHYLPPPAHSHPYDAQPTHYLPPPTHFNAFDGKEDAEMPAMEAMEIPIENGLPPPTVRRSARQNNLPPPIMEEKLVAPRRTIKKDVRGYIDAVRGETKQDGEDCLIVHWWDHGEDANTIMTRTHAASLGSDMRSLIAEYDSKKVESSLIEHLELEPLALNLHYLN